MVESLSKTKGKFNNKYLSRAYLIMYAVVFAAIGVYFLIGGHAAPTTINGASLASCNTSTGKCSSGTITTYTITNSSKYNCAQAICTYAVYRPNGLTASPSNLAPAVLVFGGNGACGTADITGRMKGALADNNKFIAVFPEVPCSRPAPNANNWIKQDVNSASPTIPSDESAVAEIVNDISQCPALNAAANQCVDTQRIYADGTSSGGNMVADIMCNATNTARSGGNSVLFRGYEIDSASLQLYNGSPNCPSTNKNYFVMAVTGTVGSTESVIYNDSAPNPHLALNPSVTTYPFFGDWAASRLGCSSSRVSGTLLSTNLTYTYAGPCTFATAGSNAVEVLTAVNGSHTWYCQDSDAGASANACTSIPTPPGMTNGKPSTNGLFVDQAFWNFISQGTSATNTVNPPPLAAPTVTLSAVPTSVASGSSSTLTWSSTNATSCTASGGWTGTKSTTGSASTGPLSSSTTYDLSCTGSGGTISANTSVTVTNSTPPPSSGTGPPAAAGYFQIALPTSSIASTCVLSQLPSDSQAAAMVHYSTWEPRAVNYPANHTVMPVTFKAGGVNEYNYKDSCNPNGVQTPLFNRVDGNFSGTTDEIIQWASAKWGLSDNIIRAEAVQESHWYQNDKNSSGQPLLGYGYGDFGKCGPSTSNPYTLQGSPLPSGYGTSGPTSFGIMQSKWCAHTDNPYNTSTMTGDYDGWPWTENSTAYNLDQYAAIIRACYEGWNVWFPKISVDAAYKPGDIWGCIGSWYSGDWYDSGANSYISLVKGFLSSEPWLTWPDQSSSLPGGGSGGSGGAAPPDTTPPTVSITAPSANSTDSGVTAITATASDNVAVADVQFQIDNTNVGSMDTTAPYSYSWDTTKLTNGNHTITAMAADTSGNKSSASISVYVNNPVTVPVSTPPGTPSNLHVTSSTTNNVSLAWTASTTGTNPVAGYYVVRNGVTIAKTPTTNTSYSDSTVAAGVSYSYQVMAYDSAGLTSSLSNSVSVTTPKPQDTEAPTAPTSLVAKAVSSSQINLSWTASKDNVGVTGYIIYRNGSKLTTVTATSFGSTGLAASTTYKYYVVARDAAGNLSAASNSASATTSAIISPNATGTIAGLVTNAKGIALSGVRVSVAYNSSTHYYSTGTNGRYSAYSVPAIANIRTSFSKVGFASQTHYVTVYAGKTTILNVILKEAAK